MPIPIREMGARVNYSYYGYSTYFRGVDFFVASIKIIRLAFNGQFLRSIQFASGYYSGVLKRKPRLENVFLRTYFRRISYVRAFKILFSKR